MNVPFSGNKPTTNDLDAFWMPFTANRQFKRAPRLFVAAERMHYVTDDGRRVLDGTSGLWCVNAGHRRPKIVEAMKPHGSTDLHRGSATTLPSQHNGCFTHKHKASSGTWHPICRTFSVGRTCVLE